MPQNDEVIATNISNEDIANETHGEPAKSDDVDWKAKAESTATELKKLQVALTRQGHELGELRQLKPLVDKYVLSQQPKQEAADYFTDPVKAVAQGIEQHPEILRLKTEQEALRQQRMLFQLKEAHPDYQAVTQEPAFQEWVQASKIRQRQFHDADRGYDFDSADELLSIWKERQSIAATAKVEQEQKQKNEADLKSAKVHTGNGVSGKKIYSRLDIMNLKTRDPEAYQALNVPKLYAEGRIR